MTELAVQSLTYRHEETDLVGYLVGEPLRPRPGVLLIHDAFGVSEPMKVTARRIAELGYTVLLADLWGDGHTPADEDEIGPLIGRLASDRALWTGRVRAGHEALLACGQVSDGAVTAVGYCFGGSSVLEYVRLGGGVQGAVSFHGGLDLVGTEWATAHRDASVLILTGADDPMAPQTVVDALQAGMSAVGLDWEVCSYGGTRHAFTDPHADKAGRPDVIAYNARADRRSWDAFTRFAQEQLESGGVDA